MSKALISMTSGPEGEAIAAARESRRVLASVLTGTAATRRVAIFDGRNRAQSVQVPTAALRLMLEILGEMADGNDVAIVPTDANLTTQQAADMLNVSRPHLVKLLESGKLPFHKAGRHRRVRCADLLAYKAQRDRASAGAMEALARQAQALRIGYE